MLVAKLAGLTITSAYLVIDLLPCALLLFVLPLLLSMLTSYNLLAGQVRRAFPLPSLPGQRSRRHRHGKFLARVLGA